ncbi:hypothetical protein EV586_101398 [Tumebacillus sp. BK434]|uniref:hypothetical protein n=1 Tax=Tumebacillus sp. BK434 TaxID=2512169 RepID=UPI0010454749|nr:hypothetical protein [Tumebacillus sp. BK434]TCP59182.1 hypothetical protein EV586_101398 [Tumebacillus sp. BK434]
MDFSFLNDSVGKWIQVERGGPDKIKGKLLGIKSDFIMVETEKGVAYVHTPHVKTISEPIVVEQRAENSVQPEVAVTPPVVLESDDFATLIGLLEHKYVQINQGGPNALDGVVLLQREGAVTIVHKMEDYVHYPIYHIKSITWIINAPKQEKQEQKQEKQEQKKENKSGDKK